MEAVHDLNGLVDVSEFVKQVKPAIGARMAATPSGWFEREE